MIDLLKYGGLDWLAMALSVFAVYLLGNKNKWGFISFMTGNLVWLYVDIFLMGSYGIAMGNFVFLILNSQGYLKWNQNEKLASQS